MLVVMGDLKKIKELLNKDGDYLNSKNSEGNTPLHLAVELGNEEVIKFLIENACDLNVKNEKGLSPLGITALQNKKGLARILIEYNVEIRDEDVKLGGSKEMISYLKEEKESKTALKS